MRNYVRKIWFEPKIHKKDTKNKKSEKDKNAKFPRFMFLKLLPEIKWYFKYF